MSEKNDKNSPKEPDSEFLKNLEKKLHKNEEEGGESPKKKPQEPGNTSNRMAMLALITLLIFSFIVLGADKSPSKRVAQSYSEFLTQIDTGIISEVNFIRNENGIEYSVGSNRFETKIPYSDESLMQTLKAKGVKISSEDRETSPWVYMLINMLPYLLIGGLLIWLFTRQMRGKGGGAFNFGKSKARLVNQEDIKETFADVQGCDEAKGDLKDIITFLKDPKKFVEIGAKIPKGVLLVGPPGTGKTMLAKAVAGEAKVPFFSMSGSDFVEMFVGVGAARVRDLFETGKKHAPCILFIDEIDAVGRMRGAGYGGGHDEREQTLNQMLVEMDGFETNSAVILMAATNRPDVLDKALLRPGRFDRQVVVDYPDVVGRKGILQVHAKRIKLDAGVDMESIARGTPGFTGADLANLINESALIAAKKELKTVGQREMEEAKDKVMMGAERKSMFINPEEKKLTAYHEAGHAILGVLLNNANSLHKVSIIPRGRALGVTMFLPQDGTHTLRRSKIETEIKVLFGGRIAEDLIFKDFTNGASNDIERATRLAKAMVCEWGMSRLGPISLGEKEQPVFIGREIARREDYSEETAKKIDAEVGRIIDECYSQAYKLVKTNLSKLKILAELLLVKETLGVDEIYVLLKMKKPDAPLIDGFTPVPSPVPAV